VAFVEDFDMFFHSLQRLSKLNPRKMAAISPSIPCIESKVFSYFFVLHDRLDLLQTVCRRVTALQRASLHHPNPDSLFQQPQAQYELLMR